MSGWLWRIVKWFLFRLDAETAHRLGLRLAPVTARLSVIGRRPAVATAALPLVFGIPFASRVGLAAGFDKDCEILSALPVFGFGFGEIGTVTPLPQPGNERPRLFREPAMQTIFNRMGFNGKGAPAVAERLSKERARLPRHFRVGVNLGKNKETPLEQAAADYRKAAEPFAGLADYLVVNVSSPNTPGLRSLQTVEQLKPIIGSVRNLIGTWSHRPPLLVKLAPEIAGQELRELLPGIEALGVDGWVLTNTMGGTHIHRGTTYTGGWSGSLLAKVARERLREARQLTRLPIISVGGIMSVEEAQERRRLGADLVQIYTGWVYLGPFFPLAISRALAGGAETPH